MARTVLHIGAHKTATTYLQKKLAINMELLDKHGIYYLPLEILRRNFTSMLQDKPSNEVAAKLVAAAKTGDVIVSDENIAGVPGDLVRSGAYYPQISERLALASEILGNDRPEIFMAMREYSSFAVSMYCEYIRHRDFLPFDEYFEIYKASGFSWRKVISDIRKGVPGAKIVLWDFSRFSKIENKIFAEMTGLDPALLTEPEGPVRESFSEMTMLALNTLNGVIEPHLIRRAVQGLARAYPRGDEFKGYSPLPLDTAEALKAAYRADLEKIRVEHPDIRMI